MLRFVNQQTQGVEDNDQRAAFVKCNCWSDIETDGQRQMGEFVGYQGDVATGSSPVNRLLFTEDTICTHSMIDSQKNQDETEQDCCDEYYQLTVGGSKCQ